MTRKADARVLVVGAGPVGLAAALTLHKRNIPFEVIERDDRTGTHSYALALHPSTVNQLSDWGLDESLRRHSVTVNHIAFCDREGPRFDLDLTQVPGNASGLLVVGQDHLESALLEPLEQGRVPIHWSHRLADLRQSDTGSELELERLSEGMSGYAMARLEWQVDREMMRHAEYVIGADGHFSMVRRRLGIEFPKVAPTQSFAVFEFSTDFPVGDRAMVVYGREGTNILWPLPGGYCRWGFEVNEADVEQFSRDKDRLFMQVGTHGFHALESDMLESMVRERAPWFDGSVDNFRWRMMVRFEKRLAERFGNGRVWLAGDAGHLTAPVGMQSMNVGMAEGTRLASRIADNIEGTSGTESLEAYGHERLAEWRTLMGLDVQLKAGPATDPFIADNTDRLLGCIPASMDSLPGFASELGLELERI